MPSIFLSPQTKKDDDLVCKVGYTRIYLCAAAKLNLQHKYILNIIISRYVNRNNTDFPDEPIRNDNKAPNKYVSIPF